PDGTLIAYWTGEAATAPCKLYVAQTAGGSPQHVQPNFFTGMNPTWSPDGKHLLFLGTRTASVNLADWDWWVTRLDGGAAVRTGTLSLLSAGQVRVDVNLPPLWLSAPDRILLSGQRGDAWNLWQVPISPGTWSINGPAQRVTSGAGS